MLFNPEALQGQWVAIAVFVPLVWIGKFGGVMVGSFLAGYGVQPAIRAGMSMTQIGEFSYVMATIGVLASTIGDHILSLAVAVSVITAFTSPIFLAHADGLALRVDRALPRRIKAFVTLYASWVESLKAEREDSLAHRVRGLVQALVFEGVVLTVFVIGVSLGIESIQEWMVNSAGVPARAITMLTGVLLATIAFPLIVSIVVSARRLGSTLALAVFPVRASGPDYGHEPRRALRLTAEIAIVLVVGTPIVAATLPFVPGYAGPISLAVIVSLFGVAFWRSAGSLEGHVRATGGLIAEALARQRSGMDTTAINRVRELMPGIGVLTPITIESGSHGEGRTLAELDVRGRTGATVVALCRGEERIENPPGSQRLLAGDLLALTGSEASIEAAGDLLEE